MCRTLKARLDLAHISALDHRFASRVCLRGGALGDGGDGDDGVVTLAAAADADAAQADGERRYVDLMADCARSIAGGAADLADAHALLAAMRAEGLRPSLPVLNAMLLAVAEAVSAGGGAGGAGACTADGERVVEMMLDEGMRPDGGTHLAMLEIIGRGATQSPPVGFLSEGYR